jgi:hypothetical protein
MPDNEDKQNQQSWDDKEYDMYRTLLPAKQNLDRHGIQSDWVYNDMADDPNTKFAEYYNVLKIKSGGKTNTPEMQELIHNVNARYSKQIGFVYDPYTTTGLHHLDVNSPEGQKILKDSGDFVKFKKTQPASDSTNGAQMPLTETVNKNISFGSEVPPTSGTYTRTLQKVSATPDMRTTISTDKGNISQKPGFKFYKHFDDGTTQEINENTYMALKGFENAPIDVKMDKKYQEEVDLNTLDEKNRKIAQEQIDAKKQVAQQKGDEAAE